MFSNMIKSFKCEACNEGMLYYDHGATFEAWQQPDIFILNDIDKIKDGIISDILVMVCNKCGTKIRYTLKELEKKYRKIMSYKMLTMMAIGNIPDPGAVRKSDRILVYCGKCSGYDGKGSCPLIIYNECKLKRFPYGL